MNLQGLDLGFSGINSLTIFCKLDSFMNVNKIGLIVVKRHSLQKVRISFMWLTPRFENKENKIIDHS